MRNVTRSAWTFAFLAAVSAAGIAFGADEPKTGSVPLQEADYGRFVTQEIRILQEALGSGKLDKKSIYRAKAATIMLAAVAQYGEGGANPQARATLRDAALKVLAQIDKDPVAATRQAKELPNLKPDPKAKLDSLAIYKEVEKISKAEQEAWIIGIVMKPFALVRVGGLDIDRHFLDLGARRGSLDPADMNDTLLWMVIRTALVAELIKPHLPSRSPPRTWAPMAEEMRRHALELADNVKKKDGKAALATVNRLNHSCTKCHEIHRFADVTMESLARALKSANEQERQSAVAHLNERPGLWPEAVPLLIDSLMDSTRSVRREIVALLGKANVPAETPHPLLTEQLLRADPYLRYWFGYHMRDVRDGPAAVAFLTATLRQPDPNLRITAIGALDRLGVDVRLIAEALKDPEAQVRLQTLDSLGRLGARARPALPALAGALKDRDVQVRRLAAQTIELVDAPALIPALRAALTDPDAIIRGHAAVALSRKGAAAVSALVEALKDQDRDVRASAAFALGRIGADANPAVPLLREMLKGDDDYLRLAAQQALKGIEK